MNVTEALGWSRLCSDTVVQAFFAVRENDAKSLRAILEAAVATDLAHEDAQLWNARSAQSKAEILLSPPFTTRTWTLMHLALAFEHSSIVAELCRWGFKAKVKQPIRNPSLARKLCPWRQANGDPARLMMLSERTGLPIPIGNAGQAQASAVTDEFKEFCSRPGRVCWDASKFEELCKIVQYLLFDMAHYRHVLNFACIRSEEKVIRRLMMQLGLCCARPSGVRHDQRLVVSPAVTKVFLDHGASAIGWSRPYMATIAKVCQTTAIRLVHDRAFYFVAGIHKAVVAMTYRTPLHRHLCETCCTLTGAMSYNHGPVMCGLDGVTLGFTPAPAVACPTADLAAFSLLPPVLALLAEEGSVSSERAQFLLNAANLPWLKTLSQIPYADGKLHDGPTCDHAELTAEQRQVSLSMCFRAGGVLESLKSLSRDVILSSLLHHDDVVASVEQLPLPTSVRRYCLLG